MNQTKVQVWLGVATILLVTLFLNAQEKYEAGKDYLVVPTRVEADGEETTEKAEGTIEVLEFFAYSCIHCYRFERYIKNWMKKKGEDVTFTREHLVYDASWVPLARAYYVAEELKVLPKVHDRLFQYIHDKGINLSSDELLKRLFKSVAEVDSETFEEKYWSTETKEKIKTAVRKASDWRVISTPSLVVDGKYLVNTRTTDGDPRKIFKIVDYLVDQVRQEKSSQVPKS